MLRKPYDKPESGEPYDLAGNRLIFSNYFYIKTGSLDWINDKGESVFIRGSEGPWGGHFQRFEYPEGIRLVTQQAKRIGPLVERTCPWEERNVAFHSILQDEGIYKAWGTCESADKTKRGCYFESSDGINWNRPKLGLVEAFGSRQNNLLECVSGLVFKDPSADASERYKWTAEHYFTPEEFELYLKERPDDWEPRALRFDCIPEMVCAIRGAVSPDGHNWKILPVPIVVEHSDTQVIASYDQRLGKYVMYTRNYMIGPRSKRISPEQCRPWHESGRRAIGRSESSDFRNFPISDVVMEPGVSLLPSDTLYTNCKTTIPGAPDNHIMFPAVWHVSNDTTSILLASSHNNINWSMVTHDPVLDTTSFGEWDGGCIFTAPSLVELPGGDFALPYIGYNFPHKYPRGQLKYATGYAVWSKGRLVGLEATESGQFTTVAVIAPGRRLKINALTKRAGQIKVEAARLDGKTIPGRSFEDSVPISGDQLWTSVVWKEHDDLGIEIGEPITLRFRMDQASIYGLEFV